MNEDPYGIHESVAPRDDAPYLGRPRKPRPKPELIRPVKLPGTEWKKRHSRFDQTKRIWIDVKGHWAKIPVRRSFNDAADSGAANACGRSLLRTSAMEILREAFVAHGPRIGMPMTEDPDRSRTWDSTWTVGNEYQL